MARPTKEGLEYFPLDVDIDQDDKLIVPIAKFGMQGFGIITKLMMEIYKNGYFYPWTEKEQYVFSSKINTDISIVHDVVNECVKWGFFHHKLYEKEQILSSKGFQKRYLIAVNRRKGTAILSKYDLVNVDNNSINDDINKDIDDIESTESTQKKLKEIKLKETIKDIVEYLNEKSGKSFKASNQATQEFINARLNDGYTIDDFKKVIDTKVKEWTGTDQEQYIRPNTLFRPSNFESYLNQKSKVVSMDKQKEFVKNQMASRDIEYEPNLGGVK